jgi:hypothetical protein
MVVSQQLQVALVHAHLRAPGVGAPRRRGQSAKPPRGHDLHESKAEKWALLGVHGPVHC